MKKSKKKKMLIQKPAPPQNHYYCYSEKKQLGSHMLPIAGPPHRPRADYERPTTGASG